MKLGNKNQVNDWSKQWEGKEIDIDQRERDQIFPFFKTYLPQQGKVLEAGCGTAEWVLFLRKQGYDLIGMDFSPAGLKRAKSFDAALPLVLGDVLFKPFKDEVFDGVVSLGVIEHFEEGPQRALREIHRVMKKKGVLLVTVPHLNDLRSLPGLENIKRSTTIRRLLGKSVKFWQYKFSKKQLAGFLQDAGFEFVLFCPLYQKEGFLFDFPFFRSRNCYSEPNMLGTLVYKSVGRISPWMTNHMILGIAKKK